MSKIYRFAMFGRSASGKTCILTALSMNHKSNPQGYTVTWVLDPPEAEDGEPEVVKQYREGQKMLERARAAMEAGDKPPPSAVSILRYRFEFTATKPNPRKYQVELVDYSGELIDSRVNAETLARKLRSLFATMDGLFVLAEAPPEGQEGRHLSREFELLQQAFALLGAERERKKIAVRTPVVLLFNKWDRRHPGHPGAAERIAQMEEFLNRDPEPPHRNLVNFLMGAVADGCYHSEAVSAFGKPRLERQTDQEGVARMVELPPLERPLPSYGLEDGFIWAARCRDEIDVHEFEQSAEDLSFAKFFPWLGLNAFNLRGANRLRKEGNELAARFPKNSERNRQVRSAVAKVFRVTALRSFTCIAGVMLLMLGLETGLDMRRIRTIEADADRKDVSMEELRDRLAPLESYQRAPQYRHLASRLFFTRSDAERLIQKIETQGEKLAWAPVESLAPNVIDQSVPAGKYLEYYANGEHAAEALGILHRAEPLRKQRDNAVHLSKVKAKLDELAKTSQVTRSDVQAVGKLLEQLPYEDALIPDHTRELTAHRQKVGDLLVKIGEREIETKIESLLTDRKLEAAGAVAEELKLSGHDVRHWVSAALSRADEVIGAALRSRNWATVRTYVGEVRRGWQNRRLLDGDQIKMVNGWERSGFQGEDGTYYEEVVRWRDKTRCQAYLDLKIPEEYKRKKAMVLDYRDYLQKLEGPLECTVFCTQFTMGTRKSYANCDIRCEIYVQGQLLFIGTDLDWSKNQPYTVQRSVKVTASLDDYVKVRVKLYNKGFSTDDLGDKEWSVRVSELRDKTLELPITDQYKDEKYPSKAAFSMSHNLSAPALSAYNE